MKTPEELAKEWAIDWHRDCDYPEAILKQTHAATMTTFLAGYKAAQEHAHAALEEAEARHQEYVDKTEANFRALEAKIAESEEAEAKYQEDVANLWEYIAEIQAKQ